MDLPWWADVQNPSNFFQIMEELASNGVEIYRFPVDDETVAEMNAGMNVRNTAEKISGAFILGPIQYFNQQSCHYVQL